MGTRLRQARLATDRTIAAVAQLVGIDASYLGELERGRANASLTTLDALARALDCTIRDLIPQ